MATVLVTGSAGHLGRHISTFLQSCSFSLRGLDLRATDAARGDVRDLAAVSRAVQGVVGIIHLAAVSRVDDAERDPDLCQAVNVLGTAHVVQAARLQSPSPWVLFVSSREVLGHVPATMPATELTRPAPLNTYARSKLEGERLVQLAQSQGLHTCTMRLSNVFGSPVDRPERVVPTFLRQALAGQSLEVHGPERTFDFVHVDDVVAAVAAVVDALQDKRQIPSTLNVVSGTSWSLAGLAEHVVAATNSRSAIVHDHSRSYEVDAFHGSHDLASASLAWAPRVSLPDGLRRLVTLLTHPANQEVHP